MDLSISDLFMEEWCPEDKKTTLDNMMEKGLIASSCMCPECGSAMKIQASQRSLDGFSWECGGYTLVRRPKQKPKRVRCRKSVTVRRNSFFSQAHLSFRQILIFSWWYCRNLPLTEGGLAAKFSLTSVTDWTSFCNEVILNYVYHSNTAIGGPGKEVEIDESLFGKRKNHVGRVVEGQWVFGGVERGTGRCFLVPVAKRDRETLFNHLREFVLPGTHVFSDCWRAYATIFPELGLRHSTVNHSENFINPATGAHTQTIESLWGRAKKSLPAGRRQSKHFTTALAKFKFFNKIKRNRGDPFAAFLEAVKVVYDPGVAAQLVFDHEIDADD